MLQLLLSKWLLLLSKIKIFFLICSFLTAQLSEWITIEWMNQLGKILWIEYSREYTQLINNIILNEKNTCWFVKSAEKSMKRIKACLWELLLLYTKCKIISYNVLSIMCYENRFNFYYHFLFYCRPRLNLTISEKLIKNAWSHKNWRCDDKNPLPLIEILQVHVGNEF